MTWRDIATLWLSQLVMCMVVAAIVSRRWRLRYWQTLMLGFGVAGLVAVIFHVWPP